MLDAATVEEVLERFGFAPRPEPTYSGLAAVYDAWCQRVPFDNLVKRAHLASGSEAPFPNADPAVFFDLWLRHGTGGTCWPSTLALYALLVDLGFDARLGSASMRDDLAGRIHSHGTIIVRDEGNEYWVDTSMLTVIPVPLVRGVETRLEHAFRPVRFEPVDDLWRVHWWGQAVPEKLPCLLLDDDVTVEHCRARYEWSRTMSPFNRSLHTTTLRGDATLTVRGSERFRRDANGTEDASLDDETRLRVLVDEFGYSEEVAAHVPPDEP